MQKVGLSQAFSKIVLAQLNPLTAMLFCINHHKNENLHNLQYFKIYKSFKNE